MAVVAIDLEPAGRVDRGPRGAGKIGALWLDDTYRLTRADRNPWILDWKNWLSGLPGEYSGPLMVLLGTRPDRGRQEAEHDQSRLTVKKEYANATAFPSETRYLWCDDVI